MARIPESVALKSSASSLGPAGLGSSSGLLALIRVCALTDGRQHTNNLLSTSARTAQPLSPEADPFVQGEALGDMLKNCRNDLEWQSRELAKQEAVFEAQR